MFLQKIEKNLTHTEKLRNDLLARYNPYNRPVKDSSTLTTVTVTLQINHVHLVTNLNIISVTVSSIKVPKQFKIYSDKICRRLFLSSVLNIIINFNCFEMFCCMYFIFQDEHKSIIDVNGIAKMVSRQTS